MPGDDAHAASQVEAALRESEERYRAFIANSSEGIWRCELERPVSTSLPEDEQIDLLYEHGHLAECNDAMARMYGYERAEEIVGARVGDMLVRTDPKNVEYLRAFIRSGYRLNEAESVETDREGRTKHFSNNLVGVVENGMLLRAWGTQRDISARKRIEAERDRLLSRERQALEDAHEASRLKDEFLATLSHELRTPLNAILGWARLLRGGGLDAAKSVVAIETIERNARAQAQLIEDLLDVSRIVTGKLLIDPQLVNPATFVDAAIDGMRPAAEAKGVTVTKAFDGEVGAVSGDPARLQQVVWNLLSNAIKFTPRDGSVEVRLGPSNAGVEIVVRDTGSGIRPEFLPYVFDRFRQADQTTTRAHGGLGLGLSIVRHIVELHGGRVRAESPGEEQGTTVTVWLPLAAPPAENEEAKPAARSDARTGGRLDGVRVLVVDDEPDTRDLIRTSLETFGGAVTVAASAAEALELIEAARPNVLVFDIGMPVVDGYELIGRVRELPLEAGGKAPAIALTAYARVEDRLRALAAGYQLHIAKPVDPSELVAAVARLAGSV